MGETMTTEWVTVPREPTEAMIDAGTPDGGFELLASVVWQQMLAASPVPPAWPFDWKPTDAENIAAALSIAMHKHVPGWGGATDEQLDAVAKDLIAMASPPSPPVSGEVVEADDTADQLNVLCEDFGCEAGSNRIHWLHDQLSDLAQMREVVEALNEAPAAAIDQLRNHQTQMDMDGIQVAVSRQAIDEVLSWIDVAIEKLEGRS